MCWISPGRWSVIYNLVQISDNMRRPHAGNRSHLIHDVTSDPRRVFLAIRTLLNLILDEKPAVCLPIHSVLALSRHCSFASIFLDTIVSPFWCSLCLQIPCIPVYILSTVRTNKYDQRHRNTKIISIFMVYYCDLIVYLSLNHNRYLQYSESRMERDMIVPWVA